MTQTTMGALANWSPPIDEEKFFKSVVQTLDECYPTDWRSWVVNDLNYEDLFGDKITPDQECRLRFAIPTVSLAKAHNGETSLSERRYKKIKRILLSWPLGRALIYVPLHVAAKVHPVNVYNKFLDILKTLRPQFVSRHEASKSLKAEERNIEDGIASSSSSSHGTKRSHSPDPPDNAKKSNLDELIVNQNVMFQKLCQVVLATNESVHQLLDRQNRSYSPKSQDSVTDSHSEDKEEDDNWTAPAIVEEPEVDKGLDAYEPIQSDELGDIYPGTKETEAKITKVDDIFVKQGINCQRFNSDDLQNIRYAEVQNLFKLPRPLRP